MSNTPLFDAIEVPVVSRLRLRYSDDRARVFYDCPHCGGEMSQETASESMEALDADPACCRCRAAFAGLSFSAWRALPMAVKRTHIPPPDFRRSR